MARVIFSLTDAQASALRILRDDQENAYRIDERCITGLRQRGLVEPRPGGSWREYRLTAEGRAVLGLVERLAILPAKGEGRAPKP